MRLMRIVLPRTDSAWTTHRKPFRVVACALVAATLPLLSIAQTKVQGKTKVQGETQVNSQFSHYVQMMALFPPAYNPGANSDYTNFRSDVMNQTDANGLPIVDGVTLEIVWGNVETSFTGTSCGPNTDTCQLDAVGQYHTYNWSSYDSNPSMTLVNSIVPWFDRFPPSTGTLRKVNLILSGINTASGLNSATPWYVTSAGYLANFPATYNRQDVLNTVTCPSTTQPWKGVAGAMYSRGAGSSTVTVTATSCCGSGNLLQNGDLIWVSGGATMNNFGSPVGTPITTATSPNSTFTYASQASTAQPNCTGCVYYSASQSSPVPYEQPYTVAWEAFLAAANLHFSPTYTLPAPSSAIVGAAGTNQLGYIRSGTWVGGESFLYCPIDLAALNPPYAYTGSSRWTSDYQSKVQYVQALSPTLVRYWPIDPGTDPNTMAQYAVAAANGHGFVNGFGSQGLSAADYQPTGTGCSTANANWCVLFGDYYSLGMPLELQQISISDETQSCSVAHSCGTPPLSAGNLRLWLPFAVANHATIFEMYYLDLALAFDTKYCTPDSTNTFCVVPGSYTANTAFMTATQQLTWYNDVGLGNAACPSGINCYATFIINNHGPH